MRKVIDSNFLQRDELRAYLSASARNYAVLTEYLAMEAYKGNTLASIYPSMKILADYPTQVIVLKGSLIVCGITGRVVLSYKYLIDESQARGFPEWCDLLHAAKRGDVNCQQQLLEHGRAATANMERIKQDMLMLSSGLEQMRKCIKETHSPAELKILRNPEAYTSEMRVKTIKTVCMLATELFTQHPEVVKPPTLAELRDTFLFRHALCTYVYILRAVMTGGVKTNKNKLRNDLVDIHFVTFATYFDGLMTKDEMPGEIYADAEFLLREVFGRPPAWSMWLLRLTGRPPKGVGLS